MSDVTRILSQIESGDPSAAEQLLPLVYDELRKLAAAKLAQEKPGQTLQATALVHDAYIRLVDVEKAQHWNSRGHFFGAAAEAMRRILVESARRKLADKRGAGSRWEAEGRRSAMELSQVQGHPQARSRNPRAFRRPPPTLRRPPAAGRCPPQASSPAPCPTSSWNSCPGCPSPSTATRSS